MFIWGIIQGSTIGFIKGMLGVQTVDHAGFRVSFGGWRWCIFIGHILGKNTVISTVFYVSHEGAPRCLFLHGLQEEPCAW